MNVIIEINKQTKFRKFKNFDNILQKITLKTLEVSKFKDNNYNVSILLCDNIEMQKLNFNFRGHNKTTNVLSFPNGEVFDNTFYVGDIAISIPKIFEEAAEQSKTFRTHFCHMFIHGVLHLLGFDHENPEEKTEMENLEDTILLYISENLS